MEREDKNKCRHSKLIIDSTFLNYFVKVYKKHDNSIFVEIKDKARPYELPLRFQPGQE
ncbi:hypothetical protein GCM10027442_21190 [Emticicia fontis]